jgi:hypothetical protein
VQTAWTGVWIEVTLQELSNITSKPLHTILQGQRKQLYCEFQVGCHSYCPGFVLIILLQCFAGCLSHTTATTVLLWTQIPAQQQKSHRAGCITMVRVIEDHL